MTEPIDYQSRLKQALAAMQKMRAKLDAQERARTEPLAIIGIGCRFPGGVNTPEDYWQLLRDGVDAITDVPPERWEVDAYYDPDPNVPGKMYVREGGFLKGVDHFDPQFFGIAPREASSMDPQQRLFLEVTWEALENAGLAPDRLKGSQTGVFVGITASDYMQLHARLLAPQEINAYLTSGNVPNVTAGRVSYLLGLHGPSMALDTACSSSLVAIHMACQSVRAGESRMAIAGGVNLMLVPEIFVSFSKWGMLSPDGRCKTFDAHADGFVRGEGCGVVVIKRLSDALTDGDNILALIRGSAANQDGSSSGLSVPNGLAQEAVIRQALQNAGVEPHAIRYVEAHGTGTSLGDPIEVEAMGAALCRNRPADHPLAIGSVKTNIGHLEAASGVAGLLKVVLALQHGQIPPHLHLRQRSPHIKWENLALEIPTRLTPWPRDEAPRIAGVSSFGFSGTNAHVILEEAPLAEPFTANADRPLHLLTLSAKSERALQELAGRYAGYFARQPSISLADTAFTANAGRAHFDHRLVIMADAAVDAREKLADVIAGQTPAGVQSGQVVNKRRPKIAFLFTGQGAQYLNMGRQLYQTQPTFRAVLDECDGLLRPYLERSLLSVIFSSEHQPPSQGSNGRVDRLEESALLLDQTAYTQPALFAIEYALARLWQSWGIKPTAVLGHSVGEYVAACVAGVFSLEDGLKLIAERGRLMQALPQNGAMAAVFSDEERIRAAITAYADRISIAAINGPDNTVISGLDTAIQAVLDQFQAEGVKSRRLAVSHAFHSPLMAPILDAFEQVAGSITYRSPQLSLISNVTGRPAGPEVMTAAYWQEHVLQPVRFAEAIETLYEQEYEFFLEVGPHPVLLGMGRRIPRSSQNEGLTEGVWLPSLRQGREEWQQMLHSLGALYVHGAKVDWPGFDRDYPRRRLSLPTYPFERGRYWLVATDKMSPRDLPKLNRAASSGHPLLGQRLRSPLLKGTVFEFQLSVSAIPFLADHEVQGMVVVPATLYIETMLEAAEALGHGAGALTDIVIHEALIIAPDEVRTVQVALTAENDGQISFQLFSLEMKQDDEAFTLHAAGKILIKGLEPYEVDSLADIQARCGEEIPVDAYYQQFDRRGIHFGPTFRGISALWRREGEALGRIEMLPAPAANTGDYYFHPGLLDACWQVFGATWPSAAGLGRQAESEGELDTYMPVSLDSFQLYHRPGGHLWSQALLRASNHRLPNSSTETLTGDVYIFDENGRLVAAARGLLVKRAPRGVLQRHMAEPWREWLYDILWQPLVRRSLQRDATASLPTPAQTAAVVQSQVAGLRAQQALPTTKEVLDQVKALCAGYVSQALQALGWDVTLGQHVSVPTLAKKLGIVSQHHRLLDRMLHMLAEDGVLQPCEEGWTVAQAPDTVEPQVLVPELLAQYAAYEGELSLLARCGAQLASVLQGTVDPLQLLFPGGSLDTLEQLYQDAPMAKLFNRLVAEAVATAVAQWPPERPLRILEIGAGTGGTTAHLLPRLPAEQTEYVFTDISNLFLAKSREKFADYPFIRYHFLDIELDPLSQGLEPGHFDLVVASNVVHATEDLRQTLTHIRQLLAPDGMLVLLEGIVPQRWIDLTFGLTEGWWKFSDTDLRSTSPLLSEEQWQNLLREMRFNPTAAIIDVDTQASILFPQAVILGQKPPVADDVQTPGTWLIFTDTTGVGQGLAHLLEARGERCVLVRPGAAYGTAETGGWQLNPARPQEFQRLLSDTLEEGDLPCRGVVHLWSLDASLAEEVSPAELAALHSQDSGSALYLVQALVSARLANVPRLWLVTRGAQAVGSSPQEVSVAHSPLWGLGKIIALEHPELHCTRIDLAPVAMANAVEPDALLTYVWSPDEEDQIAIRPDGHFVARLVPSQIRLASTVATAATRQSSLDQPIRLTIGTPGLLDTLELQPTTRQQPAPGEVEIRVRATGLNFRDVLSAMGLYPGDAGPLGGECAGEIVAVGAGVAGFAPGDAVIAIAPGSFSTFVTTRADLVVSKPQRLSFEEASTILSAYMTAYYALRHLGNLSGGERVLIHAAAGGVGMAAVQLARQAGAEIFGTAGSPEKRAFLKSMGVQHIMDSRSLDFAAEIMELTNGEGVDVVLNSLADEFISKSISVLAENGRFLEIGKRGIWDARQVATVKPQAAYFVIDLVATANENPALIQKILRQLMTLFEAGQLKPLPHCVFPLPQVIDAFRYMAQARHIGKIVITQPGPDASAPLIRANATYLITGGLAGLGLLSAEWLVERGARHLVLIGRSDASEAAHERIMTMEQLGTQVVKAQVDVSQPAQVSRILSQIRETMPPLRGIIHSAGVLDDGGLLQQDWSRFETVFGPKVQGSWLLHTLTRPEPLDFFVLFSSGSAVLGAPGQGNHAAANAFLDALAHHRRSLGLPALSINWGVWSEIGAAARRQVGQRLSEWGIGAINPAQGIQVLAHLMQQRNVESVEAPAQVAVFPIDWSTFRQQYPTGALPAFFTQVATLAAPTVATAEQPFRAQAGIVEAEATVGQRSELWQRLATAPANRRRPLLQEYVQTQALKVLGLAPSQRLNFQQPLQELGLDSLMAVELRNLLTTELDLERPLPATLVFDYPSVKAITDYLAREVLAAETQAVVAGEDEQHKTLDELEQISEDEAEALLLIELAAVKKES